MIGKLFIISGPTGVGKTTIARAVREYYQSPQPALHNVISYTSRKARPQEINGQDYFFITQEEFLHKQSQGFFLESVEYDGNWYGSPTSILIDMAQGISFLMVTDYAGALEITQKVPQALLIWLYVSQVLSLKERLNRRNPNHNPEIQPKLDQRFALAKQELSQEAQERRFPYHVCNDRLETAIFEVITIIHDALVRANSSR